MLDLEKYVTEEADLIELARGSQTGVARIYREVLSAVLDSETRELRRNPKIGPEDVKKDFRYKLGLLEGIEMVLGLEEQALELIQRKGKRS
jgi:hypothetical protein